MKRMIASGLVLSLGPLAAGCSRPPTDAVDAARASLVAARDADAAQYAPEFLGAAEDALADLEGEIASQGERFFLLRSYSRTEELAAAVQAGADEATRNVSTGKEVARVQATETMDDVRASLEDVKDLLARSCGKGTRTEINSMRADVLGIESGFEGFEAAMFEGEYRDAWSKAEAARETLDKVRIRLRAINARGSGPR
jgi:hypothetical protein